LFNLTFLEVHKLRLNLTIQQRALLLCNRELPSQNLFVGPLILPLLFVLFSYARQISEQCLKLNNQLFLP
jgi:hypothetical protein